MQTELMYRTGQQIRVGDLVRIGEQDGVVEAIITEKSEQWSGYWQRLGAGVMLTGPAFGRLYARPDDPELLFVRRGTNQAVA